ncbi:hypothetical protein PG999_011860 [Apiospora kogelbergensis]|uniref:Uncharacterized protein n=1 Tax=Apiospora kogelbergensis TaxID=1337665 RepID=A0AAW0QID8_9PEZI
MSVEMAKSRLHELYFGKLGNSSQLEDLAVILKLVTNQYNTTPGQIVDAFVKFTRAKPSADWINAVEAFLSPRPISDTELLLTCLECLRADNAACLQIPEISKEWGAGDFVATITGTLNGTGNCSRLDLLNNVQQLINCANNPYRREKLLQLVKSGAQRMRPLDDTLALLRELSPNALKVFHYSIGIESWPAVLKPLLHAAERAMNLTTTPNEAIRDMGRLLHEMALLDNETWNKLREKIRESELLIKTVQRNITHNFNMMVNSKCSRSTFRSQFLAIPGFDPDQVDEITEGLLRNCTERLDEAPDCVRRLAFAEHAKLHNLILRQISAKNLPARGKAIILQSK